MHRRENMFRHASLPSEKQKVHYSSVIVVTVAYHTCLVCLPMRLCVCSSSSFGCPNSAAILRSAMGKGIVRTPYGGVCCDKQNRPRNPYPGGCGYVRSKKKYHSPIHHRELSGDVRSKKAYHSPIHNRELSDDAHRMLRCLHAQLPLERVLVPTRTSRNVNRFAQSYAVRFATYAQTKGAVCEIDKVFRLDVCTAHRCLRRWLLQKVDAYGNSFGWLGFSMEFPEISQKALAAVEEFLEALQRM